MILDQPPIDDEIIADSKPNRTWQYWFNSAFRSIDAHNALVNTHLVLNPDFHWSRTKGNTPTTANGEFVEQWNVNANGMTFIVTPVNYTSTTFSSNTGSDRYVNVNISAPNSSDFIIYETMDKGLSNLQNKQLTVSFSAKNNGTSPIKALFYIGFDTNGDGTDDYSAASKNFNIQPGFSNLNMQIQCPKISTDSQTNKITFALKLQNLTGTPNLDIYYIKPEISGYQSPVYVDHTLEKLRIDNR